MYALSLQLEGVHVTTKPFNQGRVLLQPHTVYNSKPVFSDLARNGDLRRVCRKSLRGHGAGLDREGKYRLLKDFPLPKCKFCSGRPLQNKYKNAGQCILFSSPLRSVVSCDKLANRLYLMVHRD